jgi:hypothetical protein
MVGSVQTRFLVVVMVVAGCGSKKLKEIPADAIEYVGDVDLAKSQVAEWIGLPASGMVHVEVHLEHAKPDLSQAVGTVRVSCPKGCQVGDDKARIKLATRSRAAAAFADQGLEFGHVTFDSFQIGIRFSHGVASIYEWQVASKDVQLIVSGSAILAPTLEDSTIHACVRFAPTAALEARNERTATVLKVTGGAFSEKDDLFNIALEDKLGHMKRLARICDGSDPGQP